MKEFKEFHPIVLFSYFLSIILSTMLQIHPIFLIMSMVGSIIYCINLKIIDKRYIKVMIFFYLIMAISNPLFVHSGATILFYINYMPITFEAIVYGFVFATVIITMINWFKVINECLDSSKIIFLFKNKFPTIALMISMILTMVPRFKKQVIKITESQKMLGNDISKGNLFTRIKIAFDILLILFTWGFESSLITLNSMQARGYGKRPRSNFHMYIFETRDKLVLSLIILLDLIFILGYLTRYSTFYYYPVIKSLDMSILDLLYYTAYLLFLVLPLFLEQESYHENNI